MTQDLKVLLSTIRSRILVIGESPMIKSKEQLAARSGRRYVTVKLPQQIVEQIDLEAMPRGYRSRAEFVVDAVRHLLESIRESHGG